MRNDILKIIYSAIDELNSQAEPEDQISKTEETVIFGKGSNIGSIELVNLIVSVEQSINDEFNLEINLADERAMSQKDSPFRTVSSLADYIITLIQEKKNG
jgi:D-alanine--poly(phosphoribitol) ligase subunit 2